MFGDRVAGRYVQQCGGRRHHVVDDQLGQHAQVVRGPAVQRRHAPERVRGEVGGELLAGQVELCADGGAHRRYAAVPFPGDEAEVFAPRPHLPVQDLERAVDDLVAVGDPLADGADGRAEAPEALLDEGDAEAVHVAEVPVEGGRYDAGLPGDLAQSEAGQALVLHEAQGGVEQRLAGLRLLLLPGCFRRVGRGAMGHVTQ